MPVTHHTRAQATSRPVVEEPVVPLPVSRKCSTNVQQLELPEEPAEAHPYKEKWRRCTKEEKEAADLAVAEALLDKAAGKKAKVAKTVNKLAELHKPVDAVDKTP